MKYLFFSAILMAVTLLLISACHSHDPSAGNHPHDDAQLINLNVPDPLSFTSWTKKSELFVDFPPLVVGKESRFAAHFSEMVNFKPVEEGEVIVRLLDNNQIVLENSVSEPSSPGIFHPSLIPLKEGEYTLNFILTTDLFSDTIIILNIQVFSNDDEAIAANPPQPESDEISFLKEQVWKIDFAIEQIKRKPISEVIHTSGEIRPVKGEEKIIAAKSNGIVLFKSQNLQVGREVRSGETLFSISSKDLLLSNIEEKYHVAKARMEKSKADFERAEKLQKQQIIGQKEFERRKMNYSIAEAEFKTLTNSFHVDGQSVTAPISGIVKNVMVGDGQFVSEGTPLVELTRNRRLVLQAEVSQSYLPKLHKIESANFKTAYQEDIQSIDDYNGKLVSYGKVMDHGSGFIPVLFELDNLRELIPGSFVELFLLTKPIKNDLVMPMSALMRDYTMNYAYVQTGGESFEKRELKLGVNDGFNVQILSGISEGEWVVSKGAYQIKMASMSSAIPSHGH